MACSLRRFLHPNRKTRPAKTVAGRNDRESCRNAAACVPAEIVSVVVAVAPEGVTVAGLKEQLAPAGNPEHAKLTAEVNPFHANTVRVVVP
jgi:hypothetical protein